MNNTSKGFRLRETSDYYDLDNIENFNTQKANDLIEEIDNKIMPGTNTTNNQLANKDFVNSSISHIAADPKGNWTTWNDVPSDYTLYPADADGNKKPGNNDYIVVQDMTGYINPEEPTRLYEGTWRFTYIGEWDDIVSGNIRGKSGWKPLYQVNEKPLTAEQVEALNSGISQSKVTDYDSHMSNMNNPHSVTKSQIGLNKVDNTSDDEKPISNAQRIEFNKKVDKAQGTENAGKYLGINSSGEVEPMAVQVGGDVTKKMLEDGLALKLDKTSEIKKIEVVTALPSAKDLYTLYYVVEEEGDWPGLKLTSQQDNSTIGYTVTGTIDKDIYTSSDGKTWTPWDGSNITLNNGEYRYIWNKKNTLTISVTNYLKFTMSGLISASGNCNSMINFSELSDYCYTFLFEGCTSLTTAPDLPATTLAEGCYYEMFAVCDNLTTAPELPATTLAERCYESMFSICNFLVNAPDLPATTLAKNCYQSMFNDCLSLTTAPDLPATTLAEGCYYEMFSTCRLLNSIKLNYNGLFDVGYFYKWVDGVASSGTFYYNGSDTTRGVSAIPQNWAVQTFTP